ncbi:unnamed protein product [Lupinus luteus]|uniref:Uncharacterized protein n=1 Tax=Lupinus luteus TaxID=3873 RepID=A0AAV1X904_LUPLU
MVLHGNQFEGDREREKEESRSGHEQRRKTLIPHPNTSGTQPQPEEGKPTPSSRTVAITASGAAPCGNAYLLHPQPFPHHSSPSAWTSSSPHAHQRGSHAFKDSRLFFFVSSLLC